MEFSPEECSGGGGESDWTIYLASDANYERDEDEEQHQEEEEDENVGTGGGGETSMEDEDEEDEEDDSDSLTSDAASAPIQLDPSHCSAAASSGATNGDADEEGDDGD
ncbi:unnamed protein product [Spirodela intermedia]|uniref:Uncharacterized protein n=2 Tax=Spirodela intermedia TaxID=51605 RepID=A0A7I8IUQ4_SPIIN|nr:unnamed protein product [Spirodela intermedia]CAA6661499.1 unnamed protein product [Spirodela intermedia]CAA7397867.1 unnamed protein product [Spirodela intermedia]